MNRTVKGRIELTADEERILAGAGRKFVENGRFSDALPVFGVLSSLVADNAYYHRAFGICCEQIDDLDQALNALNHAIALVPDDVHALVSRATILATREQLDEARRDLDTAELHTSGSDRRMRDRIAAIRVGLG